MPYLEEQLNLLVLKLPGEVPDDKTFLSFVQDGFKNYKDFIKNINNDILDDILKEENNVSPLTKKRFENLVNYICCLLEDILSYGYRGDMYKAQKLLYKLLTKPKYTQYKLSDMYLNYFKFKIEDKQSFYRVRHKASVDDNGGCNHVPFEKRDKASNCRFSIPQYPCLYLADSIDTAMAEVGNNEKDYGEIKARFEIKKNGNTPVFFNLVVPNVNLLLKNRFDIFCFLVTYPFYLVCLSSKTEKNIEKFSGEYLIPQMLLSLFFYNKGDELLYNYVGIAYSSVKKANSENYVIPALMAENEVLFSGISPFISNIFNEEIIK